jgi:hypothetical protein
MARQSYQPIRQALGLAQHFLVFRMVHLLGLDGFSR